MVNFVIKYIKKYINIVKQMALEFMQMILYKKEKWKSAFQFLPTQMIKITNKRKVAY